MPQSLQMFLLTLYPTLLSNDPAWYEKIPLRKTLCWVSNADKHFTRKDLMKVITGYNKSSSHPFRCSNDVEWRYVLPVTIEDLLELLLEYQTEYKKNEH